MKTITKQMVMCNSTNELLSYNNFLNDKDHKYSGFFDHPYMSYFIKTTLDGKTKTLYIYLK